MTTRTRLKRFALLAPLWVSIVVATASVAQGPIPGKIVIFKEEETISQTSLTGDVTARKSSYSTVFPEGANAPVLSAVARSGDKLVIGGGFTQYNGKAGTGVVGVNADGSRDASFLGGIKGGAQTANALLKLTSGKILVGGNFNECGGRTNTNVAVLNSNGTSDSAFKSSSGANGTVRAVLEAGVGQIYIGGDFTSYNGVARNRIARLTSAGAMDTAFDPGAGADGAVLTLAKQTLGETNPAGAVIVAGSFTSFRGAAAGRIVRLTAAGAVDTNFVIGAGADGTIRALAVESDGKILIGGDFANFNGVARNRIARLNSDGSLDTSFDSGAGPNGAVSAIVFKGNGEIYVGGNFTQYGTSTARGIARVLASGLPEDPALFRAGSGTNGPVNAIALTTNAAVLGGEFTNYSGWTSENVCKIGFNGQVAILPVVSAKTGKPVKDASGVDLAVGGFNRPAKSGESLLSYPGVSQFSFSVPQTRPLTRYWIFDLQNRKQAAVDYYTLAGQRKFRVSVTTDFQFVMIPTEKPAEKPTEKPLTYEWLAMTGSSAPTVDAAIWRLGAAEFATTGKTSKQALVAAPTSDADYAFVPSKMVSYGLSLEDVLSKGSGAKLNGKDFDVTLDDVRYPATWGIQPFAGYFYTQYTSKSKKSTWTFDRKLTHQANAGDKKTLESGVALVRDALLKGADNKIGTAATDKDNYTEISPQPAP